MEIIVTIFKKTHHSARTKCDGRKMVCLFHDLNANKIVTSETEDVNRIQNIACVLVSFGQTIIISPLCTFAPFSTLK